MSREENIKKIVGVYKGMGGNDPAQIAYILGTVQRETGTFEANTKEIEGASKRYAPYFGRGYVQLTWKDNYAKYSKIVGKDLVNNPDLALEVDTAAFILIHGMLNGSFNGSDRGKGLAHYVSGSKQDFINARRTVNILDHASEIAGYAREWLKQAQALLDGAEPIVVGTPKRGEGGGVAPTTGGSTATGAVGLISGVFTANCTEPFPITFNLAEALTYVGCKMKLASATIAGTGFGLGAPPSANVGANGTSAAVGGAPYSGPLAPGGYIWPVPAHIDIYSGFRTTGRPNHQGLDLSTANGVPNVPIYAAADGKVTHSGLTNTGYGNLITIIHGAGNLTLYGHLASMSVSVGDIVKQGQTIAIMGGNPGQAGAGSSQGQHLHFEIRVNATEAYLSGSNINPTALIKRNKVA